MADKDVPFSMAFDFDSTDVVNGVHEFGIAAGADDLSDPRYQLIVLMRNSPSTAAGVTMPASLKDRIDDFNDNHEDGKRGMPDSKALFTQDVLSWLGCVTREDIPGSRQIVEGETSEPAADIVPWVAGTLSVNSIDFDDASISRWYAQAVAFLLTTGWIVGRQGNSNVTYLDVKESAALYAARLEAKGANVANTLFNSSSVIRSLMSKPLDGKSLGTVIVASKISWYLTNHHVGQTSGSIASFLGKVVKIDDLLSGADPSVVRRMLWAIGKYTVTIEVLRSCGLPGLISTSGGAEIHPDCPLGTVRFTVSEDVRLRMTGRPAGTAGVMTYLAVCKHAAVSHFAALMPGIGEFDQWKEDEALIRANPARYHMGAYFLTGEPRLSLEPINEETAVILAGYIHAVAPSSNLAKAPVILSKDEVVGTTLYGMIQTVKSDLSAMSTDAVLKKLMSKASPGTSVGGFALQLGRITAENVADAEREVAAEKAAKGAAGPGAAKLRAV